VIDAAGVSAEMLDGMPGVISALRNGERTHIRVEAGASDLVLRKLLACDDVHIRKVGHEPVIAPVEPDSGDGGRR